MECGRRRTNSKLTTKVKFFTPFWTAAKYFPRKYVFPPGCLPNSSGCVLTFSDQCNIAANCALRHKEELVCEYCVNLGIFSLKFNHKCSTVYLTLKRSRCTLNTPFSEIPQPGQDRRLAEHAEKLVLRTCSQAFALYRDRH